MTWGAIGCLLVGWAGGAPLAAGTEVCYDGSPARPIYDPGPMGEMLWPRDDTGSPVLYPLGPDPFPSFRDSTLYTGQSQPGAGSGHELFMDLDVEPSGAGTYLYASYNAGFQIWTLADPAFGDNGFLLSYRDGFQGQFHTFEPPVTELYFKVWGIDAMDTVTDPAVVALAADTPVGLTLWNVDNKADPFQIYQDEERFGQEVALAEIEGRVYAFSTLHGGTPKGIQVYDVTRAHEVGPCFDAAGGGVCGGANPVHRGALAPFSGSRTHHVDLLAREADGFTYAAYSDNYLFNAFGVEIRRIDDPEDPANVDGDGRDNPILLQFLGPLVADVALFEYAGRSFLGAIHLDGQFVVDLYDVTSCLDQATGPCAPPTRLYRRALEGPDVEHLLSYVEPEGSPLLYVGFHTLCSSPAPVGLPAREYLIDLRGLPNPIPADGAELVVGESYTESATGTTREINYWSSYYDRAISGFSTMAPRKMVEHDGVLYRAALSFLDAHQWQGFMVVPEIFADGFESGDVLMWSSSVP